MILKVLLLTHHDRKIGSISPYPLLDHVLLEIDRNGNKLWSWSTLDHFNDFPLTDEQKMQSLRTLTFNLLVKKGMYFILIMLATLDQINGLIRVTSDLNRITF